MFCFDQLFILDALYPHKITACSKAVKELERMENTAINNIDLKKNLIMSCNIRSFNNFEDLKLGSSVKFAKVVCLQETWIEPQFSSVNVLEEDGWSQHNICLGRGRGVSTLFEKQFVFESEVKHDRFQMLKVRLG